jgi:peptidoglycan hydrolase CwlO-like protein
MEENSVKKEHTVEQKTVNTKGYKITIGIMAAVILVLLWMLLFTNEKVKVVTSEKENVEAERVELQSEFDSLMYQYDQIKAEYGDLTDSISTKDSIILANAKEIKRLLAKTSDYNRIKRKLNYLRSIQQSYVDQLDSLYTVNHELEQKLDVAQKTIQKEKSRAQTLSKEKEELSQKVEAGSIIRAYNVKGTAYHLKGTKRREVETMKARRVDRIKICFTLAENPVAEPGKRTVYLRIARPDGQIIRRGDGDEYSFMYDGKKLQFTMKKEIDYTNKMMSMCLKWDKRSDDPAMKGTYDVSVFMDGEKIGSSSFVLE